MAGLARPAESRSLDKDKRIADILLIQVAGPPGRWPEAFPSYYHNPAA